MKTLTFKMSMSTRGHNIILNYHIGFDILMTSWFGRKLIPEEIDTNVIKFD